MAEMDETATRVATLLALAPAGVVMGFHVRYTRPAIMVQSYPPEWTDAYASRGLIMADPSVQWTAENTGSIRWSALADADVEGVLAEAATFGLVYGLSHATDSGGSRSMVGLSRSDREFTDAEIAQIEAEVAAIHDATLESRAFSDAARAGIEALPVTLIQAN